MPKGVYERKKGVWPSISRKLKYTIDEKTGCWNYAGKIKKSGYPSHLKLYFEKQKGKMNEGLQVDHLCRNRACVNADHLEPVTAAENVHRSRITKLNWKKISEIKKLYFQGKKQTEIAKQFYIPQSHVSRIVNNLRWFNY